MKQDIQRPEYNSFQYFFLCAISLLFLLFITLLVPDRIFFANFCIVLIGLPFVGIAVYAIAINISILSSCSARKSIIYTAILCALLL